MNLHTRVCATQLVDFLLTCWYRNRARQKSKRSRRERRWERSEDGGIHITQYYKSISVSKMQKKRKLTIAIIHRYHSVENDTERCVETGINLKQGTRYAIAGRGGKEGRARSDNSGIDNGGMLNQHRSLVSSRKTVI
jgi:hypothetical protein